MIGGHEEDRAHGEGVSGDGEHDGHGELEDLESNLGAGAKEVAGGIGAGGHDREVEPGGEPTGSTGDHDGGGLGASPRERIVEGGGELVGDGVGLAIVDGDDGDNALELVGDDGFSHGRRRYPRAPVDDAVVGILSRVR